MKNLRGGGSDDYVTPNICAMSDGEGGVDKRTVHFQPYVPPKKIVNTLYWCEERDEMGMACYVIKSVYPVESDMLITCVDITPIGANTINFTINKGSDTSNESNVMTFFDEITITPSEDDKYVYDGDLYT